MHQAIYVMTGATTGIRLPLPERNCRDKGMRYSILTTRAAITPPTFPLRKAEKAPSQKSTGVFRTASTQ